MRLKELLTIVLAVAAVQVSPIHAFNGDVEGESKVEKDKEIEESEPEGTPDENGYISLSDLSFHEDMAIAGTSFKLHYSSARMSGNRGSSTLRVYYANPNSVPTNLQSVLCRVRVAGRTFEHTAVAPFSSPAWEFEWDGNDALGSPVFSIVPAVVETESTYVRYEQGAGGSSLSAGGVFSSTPIDRPTPEKPSPGHYSPAAWNPPPQGQKPENIGKGGGSSSGGGGSGGGESDVGFSSEFPEYTVPVPYTIKRSDVKYIGSRPSSSVGMGGWTLNMHHSFDTSSGYLYEGGGVARRIQILGMPSCVFSTTNSIPTNDFAVLSSGGGEYYVFSTNGVHLRTVDAITGTNQLSFQYEASGLLAAIVEDDILTTKVNRTEAGGIAGFVGPYGLTTEVRTNSAGLISELVNPALETNRFLYTSAGLLTNVVTRRGYTHTVYYNSAGQAYRVEDPSGGFDAVIRTQTYFGAITYHSRASGGTNVYEYETRSNAGSTQRITSAAGAVTIKASSVDGLFADAIYPNGMGVKQWLAPHTRWGYGLTSPTQIVLRAPSGLARTTLVVQAYSMAEPTNALSSVLAVTNLVIVNGSTTKQVFTRSDRIVRVTSPMGRTTVTELDSQWRLVRWEIPGIFPVAVSYDDSGRLERVSQSNRLVAVSYTTNGFLRFVTNALLQTKTFRSDAIGRVTNVVLTDSNLVALAYQASSSATAVTPPARPAHTFGYTPVGLMERYSSPNIGTATNMLLTWSAARRLTGITYPDGRTVTNVYDTVGFLRSTAWPEGKVTNDYSCQCGRLGGLYATSGQWLAFSYDGGLLTNIAVGGVVTGSVGIAYDNFFRAKGLSVCGSNFVYQYDGDGLVTNAGELVVTRNVSNGFLVGSTLSSVTETQAFNGFGELATREVTSGGSSVYSIVHVYDLLGRITQRVEGVLGVTQTWAYAYDSAGRLVEVYTNGALRARYQYDANGNRTNALVMGFTYIGKYNEQDQLTNYSGVSYQYDAHGALTNESSGASYRYDTRGSLLSVKVGSQTSGYAVDPMGRRVAKYLNGTFQKGWLYQSFLRPAAEVNASSQVVSRFVYATRVNVPDYMVKTGRTFRIVTDHLGSVRLVIDIQSGVVSQWMDYDEWGKVTLDTNPGFQPFGYAGGMYDPNTGLVRFGFRDYNAGLGRWLSKDPILFRGSRNNLYVYSDNAPNILIDALGLDVNNCSDEWWLVKYGQDVDVNGRPQQQWMPLEPGGTYHGDNDGVMNADGDIYKVSGDNADIEIDAGGKASSDLENSINDGIKKLLPGTQAPSGDYKMGDGSEPGKNWNPGSLLKVIKARNAACRNEAGDGK